MQARENLSSSSGLRQRQFWPFHPNGKKAAWEAPGLAAVLHGLNPLPDLTVFLGMCEDGLPLLMELTNPAPGSLLILSDQEVANRNLVRCALASALAINAPGVVQFAVMAQHPQDYLSIQAGRHSFMVHTPDHPDLPRRVRELAYLVEGRHYANLHGAVQLLFLDDLDDCLAHLDREETNLFRWLVRHGPQQRVWVIATLNLRHCRVLEDPILQAFGTRLFGPVASRQLASFFPWISPDLLGSLIPGVQYCALLANEVMRFWVPLVDSDAVQ